MPAFEIRQVPRQDTAVVHMTIPPDAIAQAMGRALPAAFEAVGRSGGQPAGPPFAKYFAFGESIEFEAGVPVTTPFAGDGEVRPGEIGGCEAAVAMHIGPYDTLEETYAELESWVTAQGRSVSGPMWELYLTDPDEEPDPSTWRTQIFCPVA
jgi:effector-binding domain-containing protein